MKFKQKLSSGVKKVREKLKTVNAKRLLASRTFLVCSCAVLIAAAVGISALVGHTTAKPGDESESGKLLGNSVLVNEELSGVPDASQSAPDVSDTLGESDDLLAITVLNRSAVREDAMAVLQGIADNPDALPDEREDALAQISAIMDDMAAEGHSPVRRRHLRRELQRHRRQRGAQRSGTCADRRDRLRAERDPADRHQGHPHPAAGRHCVKSFGGQTQSLRLMSSCGTIFPCIFPTDFFCKPTGVHTGFRFLFFCKKCVSD